MSIEKQEIKQGITIHKIQTNRFKTNLLAVFLTLPITRQTVTKNALIDLILRRGTANMPTQEEISKKLENLYGASFDLGIDKTGDNHIMKFYIETINNEYTLNKEDILKEAQQILFDIIFNPLVEEKNGQKAFKQEYFDSEKEKLKQIIDSKIDDKQTYATSRCIEEMYQGKPYGLYQYGYIEDLETMDAITLYQYYKEVISTCKIDIFLSGDNSNLSIEKLIQNLPERKPNYIPNNQEETLEEQEVKEIEETMNVAQGKLVMGLTIPKENEENKYVALLYNTILGGTANSKLFQNVREKESLAYTAGSSYVKPKNNIFIRCGIDIPNYEKAVEIIKQQLEDMKNGEFTEDDIQNAKNYIISTINGIEDEQDTEITYYLGQELSNSEVTIEEYREKIERISKEQIMKIAQSVKIAIIYFLRN